MHQWLLSLPPGAVLVVHPTYILPITGRDLRSPCAPAHAPVHWMDRSSLVLMDLSQMRFGRFTMKRTVVYRRGTHPHRCTVPRSCIAEMVWAQSSGIIYVAPLAENCHASRIQSSQTALERPRMSHRTDSIGSPRAGAFPERSDIGLAIPSPRLQIA